MSNTRRKIVNDYFENESGQMVHNRKKTTVGDAQLRSGNYIKSVKLKPYRKIGSNDKYTLNSHQQWGKTQTIKEEIRNANRSLKKGLRQSFKKEIKNELNNFYHEK